MTLFELLRRAGTSVADLRKILEHVAESGSDLAPLAQEILTRFGEDVPAEKLAELASELPKEILNALQGKFDGRFHPGGAG